jgi:hypothetical protein
MISRKAQVSENCLLIWSICKLYTYVSSQELLINRRIFRLLPRLIAGKHG